MIRVRQTLFGKGVGNRFAACLASVLHLPLESVPNFCVLHGDDAWVRALNDWLGERGLFAIFFPVRPDESESIVAGSWPGAPPCPVILGGPNHDGIEHCVVWHEGQLLDPNPSDRGLATVRDVTLLCPFRPEAVRP